MSKKNLYENLYFQSGPLGGLRVLTLSIGTDRSEQGSWVEGGNCGVDVQASISKPTPFIYLGPVVQSVVSLTSSLRVISLTVLADSIYNIRTFFAEKM